MTPLAGNEPEFETIDGYRYARWRSPSRAYEEFAVMNWIDLAALIACTLVTWAILFYLIVATVLNLIPYGIGITSVVVVALVGHGGHTVLAVRRGIAVRVRRVSQWLDANPDLSGVPCALVAGGPVHRHLDRGLLRIEGSALEFQGRGCKVSLRAADLVESKLTNTLQFRDPRFGRTILIKFGGYLRHGRLTPSAARRQIAADLEAWKHLYSGEPSIFPPIRRRPTQWPRRTLAVNVPLGLLAVMIATVLLGWLRSIFLWPLRPTGAGEYATFFAALIGAYAAAILIGGLSNRAAVRHNQRIDRMIGGIAPTTTYGADMAEPELSVEQR